MITTPLPESDPPRTAFQNFMHVFITIVSYVQLLVIVLGCVGNLLSCVIFIRQRKQDRASAQYLGILAFVDLINLSILGLPIWLLASLSIISEKTWSFESLVVNEYGCRTWTYAWHVFGYMSAWVVTLFSLERMLITWSPLKMSVYFSSDKPRRKALILVLVVGVVIFLGAFDWSGLHDVVDKNTTKDFVRQGCFIRLDTPVWEIVLALALAYGLGTGLPCILIVIFNILILVGIRRNRFEKTKPSKNEKRCTKNLILVSTFFFIFMTPSAVMIPVDFRFHIIGFPGFTERDIADFHDWALLTQALNYCNFAVNPILYTFCLPFYREELKRMFCCFFRKPVSGETSQSSTAVTVSSVQE